MAGRSGFDTMEGQSMEKTAAQAQDLMTSLRESAMSAPTMGFNLSANMLGGAKSSTKRAIIMQNKQKLRYRTTSAKSQGDIRQAQSTEDLATSGTIPMVRLSKSEEVRTRATKKLDKYGFILNMDSNGQVYQDTTNEEEVPTFAETKYTERKERQWNGMMQTWQYTSRRRKRLSKQLRKGIPDSLRGRVWTLLGNVPRKVSESTLSFEEHVRKSLESAGDVATKLPRMRSESLVNSQSFMVTQETIERDIHRTYPRHSMFHEDIFSDDEEDDLLLDALDDDEVGSILAELDQPCKQDHSEAIFDKKFQDATGGQAALRRVLRAYSVYDRDVGYCQGMNFIAGMFLTFMSEEESFWLLVFVMNDPPCRMRGLFGEGMKETHVVLYIAEKLTFQFLPKLARHMEAQSIHITMYATQWLLTLYTSSFQFDLVTRVWDCFLAEGYKVVYRVMLALLQQSQATLLTLSFEDILAYFRELPKQTVGNDVIEIALKIPLRRKHLAKYEKEYHARQAASAS